MKLSKQEVICRSKLFAENHAIKADQIEIDKLVKESKSSYKELYYTHKTKTLHHLFSHTNTKRLIKCISQFQNNISNFKININDFNKAIMKLSDACSKS